MFILTSESRTSNLFGTAVVLRAACSCELCHSHIALCRPSRHGLRQFHDMCTSARPASKDPKYIASDILCSTVSWEAFPPRLQEHRFPCLRLARGLYPGRATRFRQRIEPAGLSQQRPETTAAPDRRSLFSDIQAGPAHSQRLTVGPSLWTSVGFLRYGDAGDCGKAPAKSLWRTRKMHHSSRRWQKTQGILRNHVRASHMSGKVVGAHHATVCCLLL